MLEILAQTDDIWAHPIQLRSECRPAEEAREPNELAVRGTGLSTDADQRRLAVQINYFWRADRPWLEDFVIVPMLRGDVEGKRLWEAFARYARFPSVQVWNVIGNAAIGLAAGSLLSGEARRRLIEIAILVWNSVRDGGEFAINSVDLRRALTICDEDVRAAASSRFARIICERQRVQ